MPDSAGTPWPLQTNPNNVGLVMQWVDSTNGPSPLAQVIYDNLQIWQYQTPHLDIANAVVLSWPATNGRFSVETSPSVDGPWTPLAAPLCRTNATQIELSVPAPDNMRLFRLRFGPTP